MNRKPGIHLNHLDICQIYTPKRRGDSSREIARALGVSHTKILRELNRNRKGCGGYRFQQAHRMAVERGNRASKRPYRSSAKPKGHIGDIELDTIIGARHKGALVSMVDRATKFTYLRRVEGTTAAEVAEAITEALKPLSQHDMVKTLTADNGKEFAWYSKVTEVLGGDFYFAKPYRSWERGLNEHTNGLMHQYFPKGTDLTTLTEEEVAEVEHKLNNRPRKCLNFAHSTMKCINKG